MDMMETTALQELLLAHVESLAARWHTALVLTSPVPIVDQAVMPRLLRFAERALLLLAAEPFDVETTRKLGMSMNQLLELRPEVLVTFQEAFAVELSEIIVAQCGQELQARLAHFLGDLSLGFFEARAQAAQRFNAEAIGKMGHDLKTPINAVVGFSKVILKGIDGPTTEYQQEDLTSIFDAGQQLLTMITDLVTTMRRDALKELYELQRFDVAALLGDILTVMQPQLMTGGNTLEIHCAPGLGEMYSAPSEVRWILLSFLYFLNHHLEAGALRLAASRLTRSEAVTLVFDISGSEVDVDAIEAAAPKYLGLVSAYRFCRDLGGEIVSASSRADSINYSVRLPVTAPAPESEE